MLSVLEPIIVQALIEGLVQRKQRDEKTGLVIGLILAAAFLGTLGILLLVCALYGGLLAYLTPPKAALVTGVITLLCALFCAAGADKAARGRKKTRSHQHSAMVATIEKSLAQIGHELEGPIRENPGTALLIAGLAGFMSGRHLH